MVDLFGPDGSPRAVTTRPSEPTSGPTDTWFQDCVGGVAGTGTPFPARWANRLKAQLAILVRACGVAENHADDAMVARAIQSGRLVYAADTGTADALAVTLPVAPASYAAGLLVTVKKAGSPNATPTPTLNVNSLGAKTIVRRNGSALAGGDLPGGGVLTLIYDGTSFRLLGLAPSEVATLVADSALIHYGAAAGSANALTVDVTPNMPAYAAGSTVVFVPADDNTAAVTINLDGVGVKNLRRADGSTSLAAGDLRAGRLAVATYDGAVFRLWGAHGALPIVAVADAGTADALSGPGFPALSGWLANQIVLVTKGGSANTGTAPTLNVDGKGAKTILRQDGTSLAAGDLRANAAFLAEFDGTSVRLLHPVASDITTSVAAGGAAFNIQRFVSSTRVAASAAAGVQAPVWSGISFTKQSATSNVVGWIEFPYAYLGGPPCSSYRLSNGAQEVDGVVSTPSTAYSLSCSGVFSIDGCSAGANTFELSLSNPGASWSTIFNPTSSDSAHLAATPRATLILAEVEP